MMRRQKRAGHDQLSARSTVISILHPEQLEIVDFTEL
jgi:hypothetical protein